MIIAVDRFDRVESDVLGFQKILYDRVVIVVAETRPHPADVPANLVYLFLTHLGHRAGRVIYCGLELPTVSICCYPTLTRY